MRLVTGITLLLALGILGDSKTTQPNSAEGAEEEPVHLPCNHSTISGREHVYWYRQIPHQGPEYLIHGLNNNVTNKMASLSIAKDRKSSILVLPQITMRDTAVYYCVLRDTHWDRPGCACAVCPCWGREAAAMCLVRAGLEGNLTIPMKTYNRHILS
ncbi:hypothetical protein G4228_020557 [Cervus hanglu yarkandensis]|uniref:Ig-like domain-containing protein n=1 Tax=Cervus hanglu yarkandensis TaxID=84702 RepID=A0A833SEW7_9CERV|nr:hypothetical protein G4228_020557 [Cervus hanglu yarkandensis]